MWFTPEVRRIPAYSKLVDLRKSIGTPGQAWRL